MSNGPNVAGQNLFDRFHGKFALRNGSALGKAFTKELGFDLDIDAIREPLEKTAAALNTGDFLDAAIRFSQLRYKDFVRRKNGSPRDCSECVSKANFNPAEARDERGRWTQNSNTTPMETVVSEHQQGDHVAVVDPYCKLVKQMCIVNCTGNLPTGNFGFRFWNCVNKCLDDHGCLGRA